MRWMFALPSEHYVALNRCPSLGLSTLICVLKVSVLVFLHRWRKTFKCMGRGSRVTSACQLPMALVYFSLGAQLVFGALVPSYLVLPALCQLWAHLSCHREMKPLFPLWGRDKSKPESQTVDCQSLPVTHCHSPCSFNPGFLWPFQSGAS